MFSQVVLCSVGGLSQVVQCSVGGLSQVVLCSVGGFRQGGSVFSQFGSWCSYPVTGGELDTARIFFDDLLHLLPRCGQGYLEQH